MLDALIDAVAGDVAEAVKVSLCDTDTLKVVEEHSVAEFVGELLVDEDGQADIDTEGEPLPPPDALGLDDAEASTLMVSLAVPPVLLALSPAEWVTALLAEGDPEEEAETQAEREPVVAPVVGNAEAEAEGLALA